MRIPGPHILESAGNELNERIQALPTKGGVLCLEVDGRITHLSAAPNLRRRIERTFIKLQRFSAGATNHMVRIHFWESGTKLYTARLLYGLARLHFPEDYLERVHLRMPWFVGLFTRDQFPRLVFTNRIPQGCEPVIGPFARRELAQLYAQELEGAFLLRRCLEVLQPSPQHPGCIYGEMRQCLRPCQCAVDDRRYLEEAVAVGDFLRDSGGKILRDRAKERDRATDNLDFEGAARVHRQLERLNGAQAARDTVVTTVDLFHGVVLVRVGTSERVELHPIAYGRWQEPLSLELVEAAGEGQTLEQQLRVLLNTSAMEDTSGQRDQLEDLALFARWYYSSWREGVWLAFPRLDAVPYRKIARAAQKLVMPKTLSQEALAVQP